VVAFGAKRGDVPEIDSRRELGYVARQRRGERLAVLSPFTLHLKLPGETCEGCRE